jgi:protein-tyrosine phosphatase
LLPNLRDIGGYPVHGRVQTGGLYRSTELNKLAGDDMATLGRFGIRTVFDPRTDDERAAEPDRLPDGAQPVVCDVLADSQDAARAQLMEALTDPRARRADARRRQGRKLFGSAYQEIVSLPSVLAAYWRMFTEILDDERRPALFARGRLEPRVPEWL